MSQILKKTSLYWDGPQGVNHVHNSCDVLYPCVTQIYATMIPEESVLSDVLLIAPAKS